MNEMIMKDVIYWNYDKVNLITFIPYLYNQNTMNVKSQKSGTWEQKLARFDAEHNEQ